MKYPLISEYEKEVRTKGSSILNLPQRYEFIPLSTTPIKIYKYGSGAFAGVFKVESIGKHYALRVFLNGGANEDNINRVIDISKSLSRISADFLCEYQFYQRGIVIKGVSYPAILMEWINGKILNDYVDSILQRNDKISELQSHLVALNKALEQNNMAHGDIQSGNVLVIENAGSIQLKLVDYDAMFVPELSGKRAVEVGHSSFQHPKRDKSVYNAEMDRFSFWLILTALEAIKFDKNLWSKDINLGFNDGDNFLFRAKDLQSPNTSPLIKKLRAINQPSINFYLDKLLSDSYSPKRDKVVLYDGNISVKNTYATEKKAIPSVVETPKPTIIGNTNNSPNTRNNMVFNIDSEPSNAAVYCNGGMIGTTPLSLNISQYANQRIDLSYGTSKKSFYLNVAQKDYKIKLVEEPKTYINPINNSVNTPVSPYGKQYKPSSPPQQKENSGTGAIAIWLILGFLVILGLVIWLISKEDSYSYNDAPAEVYTSADSTIVELDSASSPIDNTPPRQEVVEEKPKSTMTLYHIYANEGCGSTFATSKSEFDKGNYVLTGWFTSYFWGSTDKFEIMLYINDRQEILRGTYVNTDLDSYVFKNDRYSVEIGLERVKGGGDEYWLYKGNMTIFNLKNGEQFNYTLYGGSGC